MSKTIEFLRSNPGGSDGNWKSEALWRKDNWGWLKYSSLIAIRTRSRMRALGMTQKSLADKIGCSQQYVSLLLKGGENMTLETIAKLEEALGFSLLSLSGDHEIGGTCLSEPGHPAYGALKQMSPSGEICASEGERGVAEPVEDSAAPEEDQQPAQGHHYDAVLESV